MRLRVTKKRWADKYYYPYNLDINGFRLVLVTEQTDKSPLDAKFLALACCGCGFFLTGDEGTVDVDLTEK